MFRVLVADSIESEGIQLLSAAGFELDVRAGLDEAPLCEAIAEADAVLVRSRTRVTARAIEAGKRLRIITRAGIGVDNVDLAAATRRGVVVTNVPDATTTTTAELAVALLMALARRIPQADRNVRSGKYERTKFTGTEICGKTLGVIGFGRIGRIVADRALGLKMRVLAYDPYLPSDGSPMSGVSLQTLEGLLAAADFLTIHTPLTESTRHLLDGTRLAMCKRGVRIVNAARGGIVEEHALAEAIRSGQVAGAALDVTEVEPLQADSELRGLDAVILTPHLGASTEEAQRRVAQDAAAQIVEFARTGAAKSAVNFVSLPEELREELGPYLELAERLGATAGALAPAPIRRVSLRFRGARFEGSTGDRAAAALRASILAGCLRPALQDAVSPVSAPAVARERGIEVLESREPRDRDYMARVSVELTFTDGSSLGLDGTCFGRKPRLVALDGIPLDASLEGELVVTRHSDRPGMVGRIGTLLGERGVNLDRVDVGSPSDGAAERTAAAPGETAPLAVGVLGVSGSIPAGLVEAIRRVDGVRFVAAVRLPR
ncbi:MAG: phosphoglycerate dehydrogenase [Planctomycetes bacterium]|nr:phosphoglycerate dehydrogenase [Planctomycetota bacterium]